MTPAASRARPPRPSPLLACLPRVDPLAVAAGNRLLAALQSLELERDGAKLQTVARAVPDGGGAWMRFDVGSGTVALAPRSLDGRPCAWPAAPQSPDLPEALVLMAEFEEVIAALERSLGRPLEVLDLGPAHGLKARLEFRSAGGPNRSLDVAVDLQTALAWPTPPARADLERFGRLRSRCRLAIPGPLAPRGELGLLEPGDLVVVPAGASGRWRTRLEAPDSSRRLLGEFDPGTMGFQLEDWTEAGVDDVGTIEGLGGGEVIDAAEGEEDAPAPEEAVAGLALDAPVRLEIVFGEMLVRVSELSALAPGYVLALSAPGPELSVQIVADGCRLASGHLVALGDAYGVLVENVGGVTP